MIILKGNQCKLSAENLVGNLFPFTIDMSRSSRIFLAITSVMAIVVVVMGITRTIFSKSLTPGARRDDDDKK